MKRPRQNLTVNFSPELVEVLSELARRGGDTVTDEIRKAIQDRKYFADKIDSGGRVVVENGGDRTLIDLG